MADQSLTVQGPEEIVTLIGSVDEVADKARLLLVIDLLRQSRISRGRAAELLGISAWDMIELAAQYDIQSGPETPDELDREIDAASRKLGL